MIRITKTLTHTMLSLVAAALEAQNVCQSARPSSGPADLDLAPLAGYVEICSQDSALCRVLTAGYPPSVTTIGYFITSAEWQTYKRAPRGFNQYLIAQVARSMSPADLSGFKQYIRSQQGDIPDHTKLPAILEAEGRVSLGVFDESESSISFGTVMKLRPSMGDTPALLKLVATNSMAVIRGRVLSLYVYREFRTSADVDTTEQMTKQWLTCLRRAN